MTKNLEWWPKQFGPGDIDGDGALKLLGRPTLHPVSVLVRETAQNSWDAKNDEQVRFSIHGHTLTGARLEALRSSVFPNPGKGTDLKAVLARASVPVLEISDRGTTGLGGPLRNDLVHGSESTDYIDFVLNIGAKRDKALGGGTYGFGKTISYIASSAHTVLIWSRCADGRKTQSRLIGTAFGDRFETRGKRYTGRQWWGEKTSDGTMVEPLLGRAADKIAHGVFASRFEKEETGTSLLIIDPRILELDLPQLVEACGEAILWHLWPKLVSPPRTRKPRPMDIRLYLEGTEVEIPDPKTHPTLRHYVSSLQAVRDVQKSGSEPSSALVTVDEIELFRPVATLGHLGITKAATRSLEGSTEADPDGIAPVKSPLHSVALMRNKAELVVRYLDLPKPPASGVDFAGVFRAAEDVDDFFAAAEPPAHDSWEPKGMLDKSAKRHVNMALKRIRETWKERVLPAIGDDGSRGSGGSEGFLSAELGDLVVGLDGTRAGSQLPGPRPAPATGGGRSSPTARPRLHLVGSGGHALRGSTSLAMIKFSLEGPLDGYAVECVAGIGYEGGTDAETDSVAIEGFVPEHLDGDRVVVPTRLGPTMLLEDGFALDWTVVVSHVAGLAIDVDLRLKQVAAT